MRGLALVVSWCLLAVAPAAAQRHKFTINTETPEGQLLAQIGQEQDAAKKLALLEQFAEKFPKHEGFPWVLSQMIPAYHKAGQLEKALATGEKLIALDPGDLESAHAALQSAEAKKDPDAVLAWVPRVSDAARKQAQSAKPADEEAAEEWKRQVDFAKQLDTYTEYSLYAMALQTADVRKKIALGELLQQRAPQSQYFPQTAPHVFEAYLQAGDNAKAIALAELIIAKDQTNEGMMLAVADSYRNQQKEPDKVYALCNQVLELAKTKPRPEGVPEAAWQQRQAQLTSRAQYISGVMYGYQNNWAQSDQLLRAALPGLKDQQHMYAEVLFFLGLANFRLGEKGDSSRIADAVRFNEQCIAIPGPYQGRAKTNLAFIRKNYRIER